MTECLPATEKRGASLREDTKQGVSEGTGVIV